MGIITDISCWSTEINELPQVASDVTSKARSILIPRHIDVQMTMGEIRDSQCHEERNKVGEKRRGLTTCSEANENTRFGSIRGC